MRNFVGSQLVGIFYSHSSMVLSPWGRTPLQGMREAAGAPSNLAADCRYRANRDQGMSTSREALPCRAVVCFLLNSQASAQARRNQINVTRFVLSESKLYFYPQACDLLSVCKSGNYFYPLRLPARTSHRALELADLWRA